MEGAIALVTPLLSDIWAVFVELDMLRELSDLVDDVVFGKCPEGTDVTSKPL